MKWNKYTLTTTAEAEDMISSMTSMATRKGMAARAMSSDRSSAMELAA